MWNTRLQDDENPFVLDSLSRKWKSWNEEEEKNIILSEDVKEQSLSDTVEDEENESEKYVTELIYFENKYIKDHISTPKVNDDMGKKVNTNEEMITYDECRYECRKGKTSEEAHDSTAWRWGV